MSAAPLHAMSTAPLHPSTRDVSRSAESCSAAQTSAEKLLRRARYKSTRALRKSSALSFSAQAPPKPLLLFGGHLECCPSAPLSAVITFSAAFSQPSCTTPLSASAASSIPSKGKLRGLCCSCIKHNEEVPTHKTLRHEAILGAKKGNPPIMPAVMTPGGPLDLSSVFFRNRIIFIGQPVNSQVAQRVISQLVTLAAVDEDADILIYLNCPGGSTYSILAIYDCMSWIKPKVGTICFGVAASQGALLLAAGEKGMRYAMPNARVMIHQPQTGCGGHVEDVRRQVNEAVQSRHKIDKMYAAFTGQPLETVQQYTERDRFFSSAEALEFGLIDGLLETEY